MIKKDMSIQEVIMNYPEAIPVLQQAGLGCIGCIAASGESIEQGLRAHGLDVDKIISEMNKVVKDEVK